MLRKPVTKFGYVLSLTACLSFAAAFQAFAADRALVIGINKYPAITLDGVPGQRDLRGAVSDAKNFSQMLVSHMGFDSQAVKLLTDGEATKEEIKRAFRSWLIEGTKPGDRAVLFFAGHGAQTTDVNGDEGDGDKFDEALAPADAAGELSSAPVKLDNLIVDDEVGELLQELEGRKVLVVLDSCNSGTATRSVATDQSKTARMRTLTPYVPALTRSLDLKDKILQKRKVNSRLIDVQATAEGQLAVWTATTSSQVAFDLDDGGLFTQSFVSGLKEAKADRSGDGKVSAKELLDHVRNMAALFCRVRPHQCRFGLTPTLEADPQYMAEILTPTGVVKKPQDPAETSESLFSRDNDFDLSLEVRPGTSVKLGSAVKFTITSEQPGHLLLFDQGPDGNFRQLFPNQYSLKHNKTAALQADQPMTIPDATYGFSFEATDAGKGTLIALVAEQAADLKSLGLQQLNFEPVKNVNRMLEVIADKLRKPLETEDLNQPNRALQWAYTTIDYVVE